MPTISPQRPKTHRPKKTRTLVKSEAVETEPAPEMDVTVSSGNIFADLGFPDAEEAQAKALLSLRIEYIINQRNMTQAAAAQQMRLTQPNVSDLVRGRLRGFTFDRLLHCLNALEQDVEIIVRARPTGQGVGKLNVVIANPFVKQVK